jgi:hypothetical protein
MSVLKTEHFCGHNHRRNRGVQSISLHEWNLSHLRAHEQNDEQEGAKRAVHSLHLSPYILECSNERRKIRAHDSKLSI